MPFLETIAVDIVVPMHLLFVCIYFPIKMPAYLSHLLFDYMFTSVMLVTFLMVSPFIFSLFFVNVSILLSILVS